MNDKKVTRIAWLDELLTNIFTAKHVKLSEVEYLNNKKVISPVCYGKGWFQNFKCTDSCHINYKSLIKRALIDTDTLFLKDGKNKKGIDRQRIIENAKLYFRSYGYDDEKYRIKYSLNCIALLFYRIIITEIFPTIFELGHDINEDITDKYIKQKERIGYYFANADLDDFLYADAKNKEHAEKPMLPNNILFIQHSPILIIII